MSPPEDTVTDRVLGTMASDDLRAGLRVSAVSIAWTLCSSVAAVAIGIAAGSLVLIAFGLTGVLLTPSLRATSAWRCG